MKNGVSATNRASGRSSPILANAASFSRGVLALTTRYCNPMLRAAVSIGGIGEAQRQASFTALGPKRLEPRLKAALLAERSDGDYRLRPIRPAAIAVPLYEAKSDGRQF